MEIDEALDETSFQFASAEVFRCPNGCGKLSYDRHDKVSGGAKQVTFVIGLVCLVISMINLVQGTDAELAFAILCVAALAFGHSLFAGETTAYFYCIKCRGAMLDSKTIISKIGEEKALVLSLIHI